MPGTSFAGVWYNPNKVDRENKIPGYVMDDKTTRLISKTMPGTPITYEHTGLVLAANATPDLPLVNVATATQNTLRSFGRNTFYKTGDRSAMAMAPVGVVTNSWVDAHGVGRCTARVGDSYPGVASMIQNRRLENLSLSHFPGVDSAVELTLTRDPARAGCNIEVRELSSVPRYMRHHPISDTTTFGIMDSSPAHTATSAAAPSTSVDAAAAAPGGGPAPTPLEQALASLEPSHRALITARMEEMNDTAATAKRRAMQLESSATDGEIMRDQIDQIINQLSESERKQYNLATDTLSEQMMSENADRVRRAADRMMMACSRKMMTMGGAQVAAEQSDMSFKRQRTAESIPEVAPVEPMQIGSGLGMTMSDSLRSALAATYEPAVVL